MFNSVLKRIHQVLGNLVRNFNISTQTYVDEDDLWMSIFDTAAFILAQQPIGKNILVRFDLYLAVI